MRLEKYDDRDYDREGTRHHSRYNDDDDYEPSRHHSSRHRDRDYDDDYRHDKRRSYELSEAFIHRMEDSLHKELNDVLRYCEMSKDAEEKGLYELAEGFSEIAHEEFTHAYFLKHQLKRYSEGSSEPDPEIMKMWREAKHVLHIS